MRRGAVVPPSGRCRDRQAAGDGRWSFVSVTMRIPASQRAHVVGATVETASGAPRAYCGSLGLASLSLASGCMDVLSFLKLGYVFTSAMTGNTALLAIAIGHGRLLAAFRSLCALLGFALGVVLATLLYAPWNAEQRARGALTRILLVELVFLGGCATLWSACVEPIPPTVLYAVIALAALSMGMQAVGALVARAQASADRGSATRICERLPRTAWARCWRHCSSRTTSKRRSGFRQGPCHARSASRCLVKDAREIQRFTCNSRRQNRNKPNIGQCDPCFSRSTLLVTNDANKKGSLKHGQDSDRDVGDHCFAHCAGHVGHWRVDVGREQ
jgi:hypothetical protein